MKRRLEFEQDCEHDDRTYHCETCRDKGVVPAVYVAGEEPAWRTCPKCAKRDGETMREKEANR